MKKIVLVLICSTGLFHATWAQKNIQITNPLAENRVEIVSIPYAQFSKHFGVDSIFTIRADNGTKIYEHQLEKLGGSSIQNVLIQVPIKAKEKLKLRVIKEKSPAFKAKTFARYVPERFDDFAWENDVVAFRLYGKALEGRRDDAQGMDFWAKRTNELVINKWYKEDDYHKDHGQGLDYYSVGQTLGAGDMALYYGNKIEYTKHYREFRILDNGPIRTTFELKFEEQEIAGNRIYFTKVISLDAGQQFNRIAITLTNQNNKQTPVVVGLARRNEENPKIDFDVKQKTLSYWEPPIKDFGETGTALILPNSKIEFLASDKKQFLIKTSINNAKALIYYNGATWSKAEKITNADEWEDYVEEYAERLHKPLKVKLK